MSEITNKDIKKIARLARIEVSEAECEVLVGKIGNIIHWVETLNEVDTDNVEPLTNVHSATLRLAKDEVLDGNIAKDVLKNAKNAKYGYFAVPKVLD